MCNGVSFQAISCHFASSNCDYIDVSGTTQETIATEVKELAKKRVGPDADITYQVRLVQFLVILLNFCTG